MTEELKEKYSAFITEVSEILGLGKPTDIIKLCIVTDNFFKPLQKQVADLENKLANVSYQLEGREVELKELQKELTEAVAIIKIAREAYIKSGIYTMNSEPVYKEEVKRLYALFFDRAEAFLEGVAK